MRRDKFASHVPEQPQNQRITRFTARARYTTWFLNLTKEILPCTVWCGGRRFIWGGHSPFPQKCALNICQDTRPDPIFFGIGLLDFILSWVMHVLQEKSSWDLPGVEEEHVVKSRLYPLYNNLFFTPLLPFFREYPPLRLTHSIYN